MTNEDKPNLKQVLLDIESELSGKLISDIFDVGGRKYEMRLLTEEETSWTFGFIRSANQVEMVLSSRLAQLAIGIRGINGTPVQEIFREDYNALTGSEQEEAFALPYHLAIAKLLLDFLKPLPPEYITELHGHWQELSTRQATAQGETKNSSGEDSQKDEKENSTEASPTGD